MHCLCSYRCEVCHSLHRLHPQSEPCSVFGLQGNRLSCHRKFSTYPNGLCGKHMIQLCRDLCCPLPKSRNHRAFVSLTGFEFPASLLESELSTRILKLGGEAGKTCHLDDYIYLLRCAYFEQVWNFATYQEERTLSGHARDVLSCDWHPTLVLPAVSVFATHHNHL